MRTAPPPGIPAPGDFKRVKEGTYMDWRAEWRMCVRLVTRGASAGSYLPECAPTGEQPGCIVSSNSGAPRQDRRGGVDHVPGVAPHEPNLARPRAARVLPPEYPGDSWRQMRARPAAATIVSGNPKQADSKWP